MPKRSHYEPLMVGARLRPGQLDALDRLVSLGRFPSRAEALRGAVELMLQADSQPAASELVAS
jgi:Arc/MetJ-type ribon-helix-helix transcriptional regulator